MRARPIVLSLLVGACAAKAGDLGVTPASTKAVVVADAAPVEDAGADADAEADAAPLPGPNAVRPRALVIAPRYAWVESTPDVSTVTEALVQAGIAHDVQAAGTDWAPMLASMEGHALVIVPGYLLGSAVDAAARRALEGFAEKGGVVVLFKPLGDKDHLEAWKLAGLRGSTRRRDLTKVRMLPKSAPALAAVDAPEEETLPVNEADRGAKGIEIHVLEPADASVVPIALAVGKDEKPVGPAATRRAVGKGAVYTFGHDLASFGAARCWVNCFEPNGDVLRLVFDGALREAAQGHVVLAHTAPFGASSTLLVTHDLDTREAFRSGPWGAPGALQIAAMEKARGVRATFNVTTEPSSFGEDRKAVEALCADEECALGGHGVFHPKTFGRLPKGTCAETPATYLSGPTLCGEVRVSLAQLAPFTGAAPRVWRSPNLASHPSLFEVLADHGVLYDSTFAVGDMPYNLPVDGARTGVGQDRFKHRPVIEMPVACADESDEREGARLRHVELDRGSRDAFVARWLHVLEENTKNKSSTVLLVRPVRAVGAGDDGIAAKVEALETTLDRAKELGVATLTVEEMGRFWSARRAVDVDAFHEPGRGYVVKLRTGPVTVPGFTLELGEDVREVRCDGCGTTRRVGRRIVFEGALPTDAELRLEAR